MTNLSQDAVHADLIGRLASLGIVAITCDNHGRLTNRIPTDAPVTSMLHASPMFAQLLRAAAEQWISESQPTVIEAAPGLWLAAVPQLARRTRVGYTIAVFITPAFLDAEQLSAMCQSAGCDFQFICSQIAALPPIDSTAVHPLAGMISFAGQDAAAQSGNEEALESFGRQLSESYEEISLLYTMTRNITDVDQPERFIELACEELLATLPFAWVGALMTDHVKLPRMSDRLVVVGKAPVGDDEMRRLLTPMLDMLQPGESLVIDPDQHDDHADFKPLGGSVLVHPIRHEGKILGLVAAGEKSGHDPEVSSGDMQLVAATCTHTSIFLENATLYSDLTTMFLGTLEALTASIDAKDRYTCGHSERVAHMTQELARAIGLDKQTVRRMHIAGLVHDVGKIGVPEAVLTKPGRLTDEEFEAIKKHPEIGYRILKDIPQLEDVLPGVLYHHERWDGSGYPRGIKGKQIPLVARLIGLADSFDAMSSTRTYRKALSRQEVLAEIRRCAGTQFDPELAAVFVQLNFDEYDRMVIEHRANGPVCTPQISDSEAA